MALAKVVVDTNILIDFLDEREFDYEATRLLMLAGKVGELSLWVSSSQITDLVYILSEGGKHSCMQSVLARLRTVRSFIHVYATGESEIDAMLATRWSDPEDALLFEMALSLHADAIVTRNVVDFESEAIFVGNSSTFFDWLKEERGLAYEHVSL